ncbi:hypothetical protein Gotri_009851 [Gossypium trilobum]|uniref:Uncharacterized protein n=1 Tax=Gossypium trilobum TaxID=34281 RepID=A0A7J9EQ73_9ROSI|nr:hypothetical protein [Gossypium trilobum]
MCDSIDEVQESIFYTLYLVIYVHHYSHVYGPNDIALQGFIWNCITLCSCGYLLHIASMYSHKEKGFLSPLHSAPSTCKALVFGNCFVNVQLTLGSPLEAEISAFSGYLLYYDLQIMHEEEGLSHGCSYANMTVGYGAMAGYVVGMVGSFGLALIMHAGRKQLKAE